MIYPIVAVGDPVLKARAKDLPADLPAAELHQLVQDMYETMYAAHGVGLAAPQVGRSVRLFVMDSTPMVEDDDDDDQDEVLDSDEPPLPEEAPVKRAFLNPRMVSETGEEWGFEEGCLSIPGVRELVYRPANIVLRYEDENRQTHEEAF